MTIMSGGFGLVGNPETLIDAVARHGVSGLTVISNNCGATGFGLWRLLANGQIRKMVSSYIGDNALFERRCLDGQLELDPIPRGRLPSESGTGGRAFPHSHTGQGVG